MTDLEIIEWLESHDDVSLERDQNNAVPWSVEIGYRVMGIGMYLRDAVEQAKAMEVQSQMFGSRTFRPDQ